MSKVPAIDRAAFVARFGHPIEREAHAFGRVNLIGEHTDYNDGFVLPTSIPQATTVAIARRADRQATIHSVTLDATATFEVGRETPTRGWVDYVQGVTQALARRGFAIGGFDLAVDSTVPVGSGLSSSAALEVSILRALRDLYALDLDDVTIAKIGRAAENDFVGAPVGIMDQMASSLSQPGVALFIDTRSLEHQQVRLPAGTELVVINSGVAHNHAAGDYRTRRAECDRAASLLGVAALRDVGLDRMDDVNALPEPMNRRARHIVTENSRVLDAVAAMRASDATSLGRLFSASHASQRDDFECSVPEVDRLVSMAETEPAVFGARLTGGGFGGSIVALVRAGEAAGVASRVAAAYGPGATVLVPWRFDTDVRRAELQEKGVVDRGQTLRAELATIRKASARETHLIVQLTEGKNREIRRMFEATGHDVTALARVAIGALELAGLEPGEWREVSRGEIRSAFPAAPVRRT